MNLKQYMRRRSRDKTSGDDKIIEIYRQKLLDLREVKIKKSLIVAAVAVMGIIGTTVAVQRHVYRRYTVVSAAQNEDTQSSSYAQLGNCLLKYGDDGASLLSESEKILWNQTFEMSNPDADVRGETAVIYDKRGTLMYVLKKDKPIGAIETKFPILKARVTERGTVAAILEDGEKAWINYYASDGSAIAENQTRIGNPGYPMDLAISPKGETIAVTYLYMEKGEISSRIIYYNFADEGQNKVDNIIADFKYENTVVPQIIYLDDGSSVAFRDDGFSIYSGGGAPKEKVREDTDSEIVSTFYDGRYFGIVFKGSGNEEAYTMKIYEPSGKTKSSKGFSAEYQSINLSGDKVIMYNDTYIKMYNLNGILKFDSESEEGAVKNIFQSSPKRYMIISENGINTIKWK